MSVALSLLTTLNVGTSASIFSFPVTVSGAATNLVAHVHNSLARSVATVTFGSSDLTLIGATNLTNSREAEAWHIDAPTASTDTVTVTFSGGVTGCVVEVAEVTGSATVNSIGTWVSVPSSATQVVVQSAAGELAVILVEASNGAPNTITDTSSPALTLVDTRTPDAANRQITGFFTGPGASLVTGTFTIANGGGTKLLGGYSIRAAAAAGGSASGAGYYLRRRHTA